MITLVINGETIEATGNHPFSVVAGEGLGARAPPEELEEKDRVPTDKGRWVEAREVKGGDSLLLINGEKVLVSRVSTEAGLLPVYDLRVEGLQSFAGEEGILVHNNTCWEGAATLADDLLRGLPGSAGKYRPPEPLPRLPHGEPALMSPYPHTQIGTRYSKREGPYTQAREFGHNGEVVRDIDFTSHGRRFPSPHQHIYEATGGTKKRGTDHLPSP